MLAGLVGSGGGGRRAFIDATGTPVALPATLRRVVATDDGVGALLLGLGVRELSVTPRSVPLVKASVRDVDTGAAATTAAAALRADGAAQVRSMCATDAGG